MYVRTFIHTRAEKRQTFGQVRIVRTYAYRVTRLRINDRRSLIVLTSPLANKTNKIVLDINFRIVYPFYLPYLCDRYYKGELGKLRSSD
ncbi:hypothetical protein PUN28_001255 [Cardiocondyla obscurior]|uniref:Uncharacterized protein n=1 Tax=Cardiocondyla obscurior TaxID=286306 RepID=A0AAW2H472_9HYME